MLPSLNQLTNFNHCCTKTCWKLMSPKAPWKSHLKLTYPEQYRQDKILWNCVRDQLSKTKFGSLISKSAFKVQTIFCKRPSNERFIRIMEIVSGVEVRQGSKGRGCLQPPCSYERSIAQPILTNFVIKRRAWKNVAGLSNRILHNLL